MGKAATGPGRSGSGQYAPGRSAVSRAVALALTLMLLAFALNLLALAPAEAAPGVMDEPRINELIYPTLGNPAIVKSGESFVVEWDARSGAAGIMPGVSAFTASVTSTNDEYPVTRSLPVEGHVVRTTEVWPLLRESGWAVFRVTVTVPRAVPRDLYDLTVSACTEGAWISDTQPHALSVVEEYRDRFSFCQLTDIHVFGPECNYPSSNQKERGARRTTWDPSVGYGAAFFHKAIQQLNRIKPDFCVFTGDYQFGQKYFEKDQGAPWGLTTEYEYEQLWFYQELLELDVPVFMGIGNHDGYNEGSQAAGEDWIANWRELYGPDYYSFDYGPDYHFLVLNSMDWAPGDRELTNYLGIIMQPNKYKGALRGGGDSWNGGGVTAMEIDNINPGMFTGQLEWMRDDLAASQGAKMRVVAMHHDPWKDHGSGSMWAASSGGWMEVILGFLINMGDGPGRLAVLRLMRDYKVALEVSGHDHSDHHELVNWAPYGGTGSTLMCNTTSTSFQSDTDSDVYPGYQRIWINDGAVESSCYMEPDYSYPFYAGTNVGGTTNLGSLSTPAVESVWTGTPGASQDLKCTITNHLDARALPGAYAEFPMPYLSGGYYYRLQNGTLGDVYDNADSSPTHRIFQVYTDVPASGSRAPRVYRSPVPDTTPPTATVEIDGGAPVTASTSVTLSIRAADDGAGVQDMMISNRSDFTGASWEPFASTRAWNILGGDPGARTVYVKVRDRAMPSNTRKVTARTVYAPPEESGGPSTTWYFAEGCTRDGFEEWLSLQNPGSTGCEVDVTYMTETGENIPRTVEVPAGSRFTINVNEEVGPGKDVSVTIEAAAPILAERPMYFRYHGMWDGGHDVVGVNAPRAAWYFAEGCTRELPDANFHTWLCMFNPGDTDAEVSVTYMPEGAEPQVRELTVPARTRRTACANWDVGPGRDVSIMVVSTRAIVCERPIYFSYNGWTDGHDVLGAGAPACDWFLAEGTTHGGFVTYVCLQNPGAETAGVTLRYMLQEGEVEDQLLALPPRSRKTVCVNDHVGPARNVSIHVASDVPIIAERPMYFDYQRAWSGGHCVLGATRERTKWYFAEGCTRAGFHEWISIQNPGAARADVDITYSLSTGKKIEQSLTVPAESRYTVDVNAFVKGEYDLAAIVESSAPVIVERPMYFAYGGAWTGGTCVVGSATD